MTEDEIQIAEALARCSFLPGSGPKRFVRQMADRDRSRPLSDRQRAYLWAIAWSWRRQLPADLVALARKYTGGLGLRSTRSSSNAIDAPEGNCQVCGTTALLVDGKCPECKARFAQIDGRACAGLHREPHDNYDYATGKLWPTDPAWWNVDDAECPLL